MSCRALDRNNPEEPPHSPKGEPGVQEQAAALLESTQTLWILLQLSRAAPAEAEGILSHENYHWSPSFFSPFEHPLRLLVTMVCTD